MGIKFAELIILNLEFWERIENVDIVMGFNDIIYSEDCFFI